MKRARWIIIGFAAILLGVLAFAGFVVNDLNHGVPPTGRKCA